MPSWSWLAIGLAVGRVIGVGIAFVVRQWLASRQVQMASEEAKRLIAEAQEKQKALLLESKEAAVNMKAEAEASYRENRSELQRLERRLSQKEENLERPRSLGTRSQPINPWIPSDEPAATVCSTSAGYELKEGEIKPTWQMYRVLTGQEKRRHFGLVRLNPERPSPTILGDTGCTTAGLVHPYEIRKLTIAEVKALASFPEGFQLVGSYRARWARIGNSVSPLLMRAIAENIRRNLIPAHDSSDRPAAA